MADKSFPPEVANADRGSTILAVTWVQCVVALMLVAARMFTRGYLIKNVGMDDWTMLLAMTLALICAAVVTAEVRFGTGRHFETLNPTEQLMAVKLNWISQPFAIYSCGVGKISVALLLLRIMSRNKIRQWFMYVLIGLLLIINTICVAFIFAQCSPTRKLWEPSIDGHCLKPYVQQDVGFFQASFSSFSDLVLALFPLIIIWKLNMKMAVKLGLGSAMSLGLLATGAAIVKTIQLEDLTAREDYTYDTVDLVIWFTTEMYTIIIAACVPTLRPLLPLFYGRPVSQRGARGREAHSSSWNKTSKKGYLYHTDEEAYQLQTIAAPSTAYTNITSSPYSMDSRGPPGSTRSAGHFSDQRGETSRQHPEPNEILKTTKIDVSIRKDLPHENASHYTGGENRSYAENDMEQPYYTLR